MCPRSALRALFFALLLTAPAFASELKIKVLDPQSARVAGAQVSVYRPTDDSVVAVVNTDAHGEAVVHHLAKGDYKLEVLAAGFTAGHQSFSVPGQIGIDVNLTI